jgi:hypothetical protein
MRLSIKLADKLFMRDMPRGCGASGANCNHPRLRGALYDGLDGQSGRDCIVADNGSRFALRAWDPS